MKRKYIKAIPAFLIICMLLIYSIILGNVEISFTAKGCKIETSILLLIFIAENSKILKEDHLKHMPIKNLLVSF